MAMNLEEQEQLEELKLWWKRYGNIVTVILLVAAVGMLGWVGWNSYKIQQAQAVQLPYSELIEGLNASDTNRIKAASDTLAQDFSTTLQATMGNMQAAAFLFHKDEIEEAEKRYQWVLKEGVDADWKMLARLNLYHVLIDQNRLEDALKLLDVKPIEGYEARLLAARGDVYLMMDRPEDARKAYKNALEVVDDHRKPLSEKDAEIDKGRFAELISKRLDIIGE